MLRQDESTDLSHELLEVLDRSPCNRHTPSQYRTGPNKCLAKQAVLNYASALDMA